MIGARSCGTSATVTLKAANAVPARPAPSPPPPCPSETLTLNAWDLPPSYMLGVHVNVPFGRIVAPHGMSPGDDRQDVYSPSSPYLSRCAGRSASEARTAKRISDSSAAFMSGIASMLGGPLSSATAMRKVRTVEFPCDVAFTTNV